MINIPNLEIHLTHSCNLKCESCSHYSNHGHSGILSLEEAERWFDLWHKRINPKEFSLLGGEPTINPDLVKFVLLSRGYWPEALLRIVTNGFFLHRHPELPLAMKKVSKAELYLTIHHNSLEYKEKILANLKLIDDWIKKYRIKVFVYESFKSWTRRYKGFGSEMEPFEDMQPRLSWENCPAKYCPQLFEGNIWKCAPLAYLEMQDAKYKLSKKWKPYLKYKPLPIDCSDKQLLDFFNLEEEHYCGMCASKPRRLKLPLPLA